MDSISTQVSRQNDPPCGLDDVPATSGRDERNGQLRQLIGAAAQGDVKAFEEIYASTVHWLLQRIRRIAGDMYAEDVLADVYLQVWRSLPSYDTGRGEPLAWLLTIARSRALDRLRAEKRSHGGLGTVPEFRPDDQQSHCDGPETLLASAQAARLLHACMGRLSPKERLVLGLAYFRDCTQDEIAMLTGLPLGSVKTLMTRSQKKLRNAITPPLQPLAASREALATAGAALSVAP